MIINKNQCYLHAVIDCGPLANPANGQVDTSSGTSLESTATYSCNGGYSLSHQETVTCGADEMWSPTSPTCVGEPIATYNIELAPS